MISFKILCLDKGKDMFESIKTYIKEQNYRDIVVLGVIGLLINIKLINPIKKILPGKLEETEVQGPLVVPFL